MGSMSGPLLRIQMVLLTWISFIIQRTTLKLAIG